MCRNVNTEKPTTKAIVSCAVSESMLSQVISGFSSAAKTGSPTQPRPRLARVMPNWQALKEASRLAITRRATFAPRCPLSMRGESCVSRIFTSANSAATKKPLSSTSATTARSLSRMEITVSMLQAHLSEHDFQDILQADNADLALVPAQHNRQALAASLHPGQGFLEPHLLGEIESRFEIIARGLAGV